MKNVIRTNRIKLTEDFMIRNTINILYVWYTLKCVKCNHDQSKLLGQ